MAYRSGLQALQDSIKAADERAKAAQSGGFGSQLGYFTWQPGDRKILRFLDDDVIIDNFWNFVISNTGNPITFLVDPEDPDRLKRYMSPTPGIGWKKEFKTGALVEPTTAELGVGIAVLRDEVRGPDGKLHLQDVLTDKTDKENDKVTYPCRQFGVVQQNPKTFWHTLATSCLSRYGTICDRDYEITREGEGFNTKYSVIPLEQDPDLATIEAVQSFYFYGQPIDPEDPQRFLKCPQTLKEWAAYYGGEERYKFWLTPNDNTPAWLRSSWVGAPTPAPQTAPAFPTPPPPVTPRRGWIHPERDGRVRQGRHPQRRGPGPAGLGDELLHTEGHPAQGREARGVGAEEQGTGDGALLFVARGECRA